MAATVYLYNNVYSVDSKTGQLKISANAKRFYDDCSLRSYDYNDFMVWFSSEDALYNEFAGYASRPLYYKYLLFTQATYNKVFTGGGITISMANIIDKLMLNFPNKVAISESCVLGEITSPICSDSGSLYANDQWVGKYFVVDVNEVGTDLADIKVHVAILEDPYIVTVPLTLYIDECYLFETGWGIVKLNIRALQGNVIPRFVQLRECIMPSSALETSTCYQIKLEDYIIIPKECPIPSATLSITLDNEIATGIITTNPGKGETITDSVLHVYNGTDIIYRKDIDLIGEAKTEIFTWNVTKGSAGYFDLYLKNSCGKDTGLLTSKMLIEDICEGVICEDRCIGYDLYSQKCVNGKCVTDTLIEKNSPSCDYIPPCIPDWQCEIPLNGYEEDGCGNRRYNADCEPCIPDWQCEIPLNGYEEDGCGNRRYNADCEPEEEEEEPVCTPGWVCELDIEGKNTGVLIDGCGNSEYNIILCPIGEKPTDDSFIPIAIGLGVGLLGLLMMRK